MNWINDLSRTINNNSVEALAILTVLLAVLVLAALYLILSVVSLKRRYSFLLRHEQTQDLGGVFNEHARRLDDLDKLVEAQGKSIKSLADALPKCIQGVGVVKYDAFDDVGGQQSYAVAIVDSEGSGVIFTSIYSRSDSRTYAKALTSGKASSSLTPEEEEALAIAVKSSSARTAAGVR